MPPVTCALLQSTTLLQKVMIPALGKADPVPYAAKGN